MGPRPEDEQPDSSISNWLMVGSIIVGIGVISAIFSGSPKSSPNCLPITPPITPLLSPNKIETTTKPILVVAKMLF